ncbi:MAG: helix-turn-helix domain-containing protein [Eikenella sp.]|nr:helix-turn-helix domain-containing protein [Eikenella sp.]
MSETKRPVGRPGKYKPEYAEQAEKLCLIGATDDELADFFGVSVATLNNWKTARPEFLESIKKGKMLADAEVGKRLYQRALGYDAPDGKHYPPDTVAAIFWLKNRRPQAWRDKPEPDNGEQEAAPVKVVVEVKDARRPDADA